MRNPCIVALGGGGFSTEPDNPRLDRYLLSLTGKKRPKVLFLPTASGDSEIYCLRFYSAFTQLDARPTHLSLFKRDVKDLRALLLDQDLIYVSGGNTANMLAIWRVHGLDVILREAWEAGIVLCGISAGALCWFEEGLSDSFGAELSALKDGLGFLPFSHCPHYDGEALRRPRYREMIRSGELGAGYAADDGAALRFEATRLVEVVCSRPESRAFHVRLEGNGVKEEELSVRLLEP